MLVNRRKRMISLPFALDEKLCVVAQKDCRSVSSFVEKVLTDYLDKIEIPAVYGDDEKC